MQYLTPYIDAILAGATVASQARLSGEHRETLARLLREHPGYARAEAEGKLHGRGAPTASGRPHTVDEMRAHPAVVAVMDQGLSQAESAREYGVSSTDLSKWVRKAYPGYEQPSGRGRPRGSTNKAQSINNTSPAPDTRGMLPVISWVQAGYWSDPVHQAHEEPETYLPCPRPHSAGSFVLRVEGDSMVAPSGAQRTYPPGCFVYVDPEKRNPTNGDRVIARMENSDRCTFKVFKNEDDRTWLVPLNPQHPTMHERFTVVGTVIGKWEDG